MEVVGHYEVVEHRAVLRDDVGLAEIEEAIAHTTNAMRAPDADLPGLMEVLRGLNESRAELSAAPRGSTMEVVETGETYRERWDNSDTDGRRAMLEDVLRDVITVFPVGRGHRRIDDDRVRVPWPWAPEYGYEEFLRAAQRERAYDEWRATHPNTA